MASFNVNSPAHSSRFRCPQPFRQSVSPDPTQIKFALVTGHLPIAELFLSGLFILGMASANLLAANEPAAIGFRPAAVVFKNATIVTEPGKVLEKSDLLVRGGRISALGAMIPVPADAESIDATGLTIYPGFIDGAASVFLQDFKPQPVEGRAIEISKYALAGMRHDDRNGLTPEFDCREHLSVRHEDQEKYRQAGFVAVHVLPQGRIASGQGTVLNLASIPLRESLLTPKTFSTLQLSERGGGEYPATNMGVHAHLRQAFLDAQRHALQSRLFSDSVPNIPRPANDPALDAFLAMRHGGLKTAFLAMSRDDHDRALNFAAEQQLRPVIWGGHEAWQVIDRLKKAEVDVIAHVDFGDEPKVDAPKPGDDPWHPEPEVQSGRFPVTAGASGSRMRDAHNSDAVVRSQCQVIGSRNGKPWRTLQGKSGRRRDGAGAV